MTALRALVFVLLIVLAGVFSWFSLQWARTESNSSSKPYGVAFELIDQNGNTVTETAFQEKPTALFFGFTHCPDVCPTTLFELDSWMRKADPSGERLRAFMVTVDPERDTYQLLSEYISNVSDRIIGISGDPEKVREMARGFNVYLEKVPTDPNDPNSDYVMNHTASVFLLDRNGQFRGTIAYGEDGDVAVKKLENLR